MDRLIYKESNGDLTCRSRDFDKVFPTLHAYEETGLTPEEVMTMAENLKFVLAIIKAADKCGCAFCDACDRDDCKGCILNE